MELFEYQDTGVSVGILLKHVILFTYLFLYIIISIQTKRHQFFKRQEFQPEPNTYPLA